VITYWTLFLAPSLWALLSAKPWQRPCRSTSQALLWFLVFIGLTLIIGLRHEVGGDWDSYLVDLELARWFSPSEWIFKIGVDPAYFFLTWIAVHWGGGIYLVNTVCGLIFSLGLLAFCRQLPRPWLALAVAMPYLVTVVAMGYSRQGVAIGIIMWGLPLLQRGLILRFLLVVIAAGLFHKAAFGFILLAFVSRTKNKFLTVIALLGVCAGLYALTIANAIEMLILGYLETKYQSAGAGVRVAMNALPGLLLLCFYKKLALEPNTRRLWLYLAWASIGFVGLLQVSPSSTAVDRLALFLTPLQLFVWSHFPDMFGRVGRRNLLWVLTVLGVYAAALFVWLFWGVHSAAWIPYKFYPVELLERLP